jgi:hypothetical protein
MVEISPPDAGIEGPSTIAGRRPGGAVTPEGLYDVPGVPRSPKVA